MIETLGSQYYFGDRKNVKDPHNRWCTQSVIIILLVLSQLSETTHLICSQDNAHTKIMVPYNKHYCRISLMDSLKHIMTPLCPSNSHDL